MTETGPSKEAQEAADTEYRRLFYTVGCAAFGNAHTFTEEPTVDRYLRCVGCGMPKKENFVPHVYTVIPKSTVTP